MSETATDPAGKLENGATGSRRNNPWRTRGRWAIVSVLVVLIVAVGSAFYEDRAERDFRLALLHLASVLSEEGKPGTPATGTISLLKADGLPKPLSELQLRFAIDAPHRLRLSGRVAKENIHIGRDGQQIWVWQPDKPFAVRADPGVPRFAAAPETSIDDARLRGLELPFDRRLLSLAVRFLDVTDAGSDPTGVEPCRVLHAKPGRLASAITRRPQARIQMWVREKDGWPVKIALKDGMKVDAVLALEDLQPGNKPAEEEWRIPAEANRHVEVVALSHLQRMFGATAKILTTKLPSLPAVTGSRKLVATHGKGRLELHDGTRVLFLRGTPEEMGEQQGTLLRENVRDLVDRVLYGVGVGSSFLKGRWFFGEIEQCQSRIQPFIHPRYLREMDAMAGAAGVTKEEMRLANFFPELFHCSGFAVMGDATEGRRIYHGRILDYMKGIGLEGNAVVTVNQPDQGYRWVNVGYAGFVGSVTGMNEKHISIGEMGGKGEGNWDGKPMAQLVREVMEKAGTLEEAIDIMRAGPRTCEYFYVIADGKTGTAAGIAATPDRFEVIRPGEIHPRLQKPVKDAVLLSAGERYEELVRRVQEGYGKFDADAARELMTRPVCMTSNIHSVLFAPDTLDFWVANADGKNVASHTRYTKYNLGEMLKAETP